MKIEPTIEQMDLAIARFMGMEGTDEFIRQNYKYHSSWDALMPCWKKVTDTVAEISEDGIYPNDFSTIMDMYAYHCEKVELGAVHNYVYQAIQWYNKQSATTNE